MASCIQLLGVSALRAVSMIALVGLVACGGGSSNSNPPAPTAWGTWTTTRYFGTQAIQTPVDLSTRTIQAMVPQGATYQVLAGAGKADGTFSVPNIPPSGAYVSITPPGVSSRTMIWSSGIRMDLNSYSVGDTSIPRAAYPSATTLNLDLGPLGVTAHYGYILSAQIGFYRTYSAIPAPITVSWGGAPLLDTSRDRDLIITSMIGGQSAGSGGFYDRITGYAQSEIAPFRMQDGVANPVVANLVPQNTSLATFIQLDANAFADGPFNPRTTSGRTISAEYFAQYLAGDRGPVAEANAPIGAYRNATLTGILDTGVIAFADPFPPSWARVVRVSYLSSVPMTGGAGGTQTVNFQVGTSSYWMAGNLPTGVIRPLVGPVGNPKANDQPLSTTLSGQGLTPLLTWGAPVIGQATHYVINIIDFSDFLTRLSVTTPHTRFQVPAGTLSPGGTYAFIISARYRANGYDSTRPFATGWPYGSATIISEPYTP